MKKIRYYIIEDLKTWATSAKNISHIEYYDNLDEAAKRFYEIKPNFRHDDKFDLDSYGCPYARLTLGIQIEDDCRKCPAAVDLIHVRNGENCLVSDAFSEGSCFRDADSIAAILDVIRRIRCTSMYKPNNKHNSSIKIRIEDSNLPDLFSDGKHIHTERGIFCLTNLSVSQMRELGFGIHHYSSDYRFVIMGDGRVAYAIKNSPLDLK